MIKPKFDAYRHVKFDLKLISSDKYANAWIYMGVDRFAI